MISKDGSMSDLTNTLMATLGVTPTPTPVVRPPAPAVPPRPEPLYEFSVEVHRTEYGSATIQATSKQDVYNQMWDVDFHWYDCGDTDTSDVTQESDEPSNQHEIDEWDELYAEEYDYDGHPLA
jgi:hypothetical protein